MPQILARSEVFKQQIIPLQEQNASNFQFGLANRDMLHVQGLTQLSKI